MKAQSKQPLPENAKTSEFSTDVCVCGGGPAGWIAAVASARNGAKTVLVERYGFPGGLATAGLVGPISKFNLGGERIVGGIPLESIDRMSEKGGAICDLPSGNVPFDAEIYKNVALEMLAEAGVEILFHTEITGCKFSATGRIARVLGSCRGRKVSISTKYAIDATGTGDLVGQSPLPCKMRSAHGEGQPMSLMFVLGGVDTDAINLLMAEDNERYASAELREILSDAVKGGELQNFGGPWALWGSSVRAGQVSVNATRVSGEATDVRDVSQAEITARAEMQTIIKLFKEKHPAFKDCHLISSAILTGYREGRAIESVYQLTADDVTNGVRHDDCVCLGGHPVDRHVSGSDKQNVKFIDKPYGIPYRCMIPQGSENVLASGATVGADNTAFATIRTQAQCMAMGQAAGTASALCARNGCAVMEIDTDLLQRTLKNDRAIF